MRQPKIRGNPETQHSPATTQGLAAINTKRCFWYIRRPAPQTTRRAPICPARSALRPPATHKTQHTEPVVGCLDQRRTRWRTPNLCADVNNAFATITRGLVRAGTLAAETADMRHNVVLPSRRMGRRLMAEEQTHGERQAQPPTGLANLRRMRCPPRHGKSWQTPCIRVASDKPKHRRSMATHCRSVATHAQTSET